MGTVKRGSDAEGSGPNAASGHRLSIERTLRAPREIVWEAFTKREHIAKWMCPKECRVVSVEGELRVGGCYREVMNCGGQDLGLGGEYREIDPPARLVFTHRWDEPGAVETLVTIELALAGSQTRLRLMQTGLKSAESARGHEQGWGSALDNLAEYLGTFARGG